MVRRASSPTVLGVDIGGTKVAARLSMDGQCLDERRFELPHLASGEAELKALADFLRSFRDHGGGIDAIGVAAAPTVDVQGRVVRWPNRAHWRGLALGQVFEDIFGLTAVIRDDGSAAAIADAGGLGIADLAHLSLGTGVGGGVVLAGQPFTRSTEFGHMIMLPGGRVCQCGRQGCLQAYASATALQERALGASAPHGMVRLEENWSLREEKAVVALDEAVRMLSIAAQNLVEIFSVSAISFSGGVVDVFPQLPDWVNVATKDMWREGQVRARFYRSPYGAGASLAGAEALALLTLGGTCDGDGSR